MKITAKVLILFLLLLIVFAVGSGIWGYIRRSLPSVPISQSVTQQPLPQVPSQPTPVPGTTVTAPAPGAATGTAIKAKAISPVILSEAEIAMEKGKAHLDVYNIDCHPDDNLPAAPVFVSTWSDFDTQSVQYSKKTKNSVFTTCTLGNFKFYYFAPEDGFYVFGIRESDSASRLSLRANGVLLFPLDFYGKGTETVQLQKGWYEMDMRLFKDTQYGHTAGFTFLIKLPSENEMHILTSTEIFMGTRKEKPQEQTQRPLVPAVQPGAAKGGK